ncbi:hypothetical protein D5086_020218 [Populus alba]|uniref:Uncharacterized protein n=1 Tax=Populus alba TaxID=43335 RepID=A0ACC4BJH9_POPAL
MSFITLNHGVSFIFGWTGYPSVDKQGMPFVNIKEGKKTRVIITSQISSSRYPYFRFVYQLFTGIMMDSNIQEKVHKVEEFFDGHLKPQLVRAIAERDKVFEQQKMLFVKEHRELREEQRTMVNLGSVLYMQVDVPDTHRIFVDVGLGFHVEFTWQTPLSKDHLLPPPIRRQPSDGLWASSVSSVDIEDGGQWEKRCLIVKRSNSGIGQHGGDEFTRSHHQTADANIACFMHWATHDLTHRVINSAERSLLHVYSTNYCNTSTGTLPGAWPVLCVRNQNIDGMHYSFSLMRTRNLQLLN